MDADPTVTYDDTMTSVLIYSGTWTPSTWNVDGLQNSTMHVTTDLTASVSFTFPVAATAFSIFIVEQNAGGHCSICVDCTPNPQAITVVEAPRLPATSNTAPPVLLFQQTFDAPGIHTVVLSNMPDPTTPGNSSQIALASFVLIVPQTAPPASLIAAPGTTTLVAPDTSVQHSSTRTTPLRTSTTRASSTSTASQPTSKSAPSSSSPTATPTPSVSLRADRAHQVVVIVGVALGALALLCGLVVFIWWRNLRRRRRRASPRPTVTSYKWRRGVVITPVLPVLPAPPASTRPSESVAEDAAAPTPPSPSVPMYSEESADALATAVLLSRHESGGTARQKNRFDEDPPPYEDYDGVP